MSIFDLVKKTIFATLFLVLIITNLILWLPLISNEYIPTKVVGESMIPTFRSGDLLIIKDVDPAEIDVGNIITVRYDDSSITHRLVEKIEGDPNYYRLKGDGNEKPDPGVFEESRIIGKVVWVLPLSHLYTVYGFTLAVVIPFALMVHRLREGRTPMLDRITLLLFALLAVSTSLTVSHYVLKLAF